MIHALSKVAALNIPLANSITIVELGYHGDHVATYDITKQEMMEFNLDEAKVSPRASSNFLFFTEKTTKESKPSALEVSFTS
ncbi:MAG: hypothetical protein ACHP6H_06470, partial [Legionellales bacterium]